MSQPMTVEAREAFLSGLHIGLVSLNAPSGAPQVMPLWYEYLPGGDLRLLIAQDGPFSDLLRRSSRASVCAQDEFPPYRFVTVEGPLVAILPADRELDFRPLVKRYLPHMWVDDYIRRMWPESAPAAGHMLLAHLRPEAWVTVDYWDDYAAFFGNAT